MHEELVNILLYDAGWLEQGMTQTEHDIAEHLKKAADAIEELSKKRDAACWGCKCEKIESSRWIPVTERLPEKDCHVLAYYGFDHGDGYLGMMFMQVLDYYANDPKPHFQHEGMNGMKVTHWMPLPEPPKEEA